MDKAQKYTDKAILQIEKLKMLDPRPILSSFHVLLLEHIVQCKLVTGEKAEAIQKLGTLCHLLEGNTLLLQRHRAQLHTLLGLYAMSMNQMDWAETQLNAALRVRNLFCLCKRGCSYFLFSFLFCRLQRSVSCGRSLT